MKLKGIVFALVGAVILVIGLGLFFYNMSIDNKEISLREQFKAQVKVCMTSHDAMWKILSQKAQVSDQYKQAFEKIYPELIAGRYSKGDGALMKWITEQNPTFDVSLYKDLSDAISDERTKFKRAQDICTDVSREYITFIKKSPATWFIDDEILEAKQYTRYSKEEVADMNLSIDTKEVYDILTYKPVTSTQTEDVFKTGKDDNVKLFN